MLGVAARHAVRFAWACGMAFCVSPCPGPGERVYGSIHAGDGPCTGLGAGQLCLLWRAHVLSAPRIKHLHPTPPLSLSHPLASHGVWTWRHVRVSAPLATFTLLLVFSHNPSPPPPTHTLLPPPLPFPPRTPRTLGMASCACVRSSDNTHADAGASVLVQGLG